MMQSSARTGFVSIQSNVTELLAGICAAGQRELSQLLSRELVMVARPGLDRWLSQFLAGRHGIAWDLQSIPQRKLWVEVARSSGVSCQALMAASPSRLRFRIFAFLMQLSEDPVWDPIRAHAQSCQPAFEFAQLQASLFEEYLSHRPSLLSAWEEGADPTCWQAALWRELWPGDAAHRSPAGEMARIIERLADLDPAENQALAQSLGPRIHVFGCTQIPLPTLQLMKALGEHLQVRNYQLVPSPSFLGQTQDEHPLLSGWSSGYSKASLAIERLALRENEQRSHFLAPDPSREGSDLERLCQSFYDANADTFVYHGDRSIGVHGCAGMMREVEVLHDRIASTLLDFPDWSYEDVVVWVSDLSSYAPYIEAVFEPVEPASGPQLPYRIVDRHQSPRSPAFLTLFALLDSFSLRSTRDTLLDLMGLDTVRQAFDWNDERLLALEEGIDRARIRWGQNAQERAEQGQPAEGLHSWEQGLWRWVLGCAYQRGPWADADLPLIDSQSESHSGAHVEALGGMSQVEDETLGQFARFLDVYFQARNQASQTASLQTWVQRCHLWMDQFVPTASDPRGCDQLRACLETLLDDHAQSGAGELTFDLGTFGSMLASVSQMADAAALWGRGGVTFAQLHSARPVPANLVALLGMGEGQFPRNQAEPTWNLRAQSLQEFELRQRDEDRMAMLETLLCARNRWLCTYSSRDLRGEHQLSPSPLVQELKAFLDARASQDAAPVQVEHPLSSFAATAWLNQDPRLTGHQGGSWKVAKTLSRGDFVPPKPAIEARLPDASELALELAELQFYLSKASSSFLQRRLGIAAQSDKDPWPGTEPGVLETLERYQVAECVLASTLLSDDQAHLHDRLRARGLLPWGQAGPVALRQIEAELAPLLQAVKRQKQADPTTHTWSHEIQGRAGALAFEMHGQIETRMVDGRRSVVFPAKINAKRRIRAWTEHLFLCASGMPGYAGTQVWGVDKRQGLMHLGWPSVDPASASGELAKLVELYRLGQQWPLPIFLESSLAYAKAVAKQKTHMQAVASARSKYVDTGGFGENESVKDWPTQLVFSRVDALSQKVLGEELGEAAPSRWADKESDFAAISLDLWATSLAQELTV